MLTAGTGIGEAFPSVRLRVFDLIGEQGGFAEMDEQARLHDAHLHRLVGIQCIGANGGTPEGDARALLHAPPPTRPGATESTGKRGVPRGVAPPRGVSAPEVLPLLRDAL